MRAKAQRATKKLELEKEATIAKACVWTSRNGIMTNRRFAARSTGWRCG